MSCRVVLVVAGTLVAAPGIAGAGSRHDRADLMRELARRVGQVVGAASACRDIATPRIAAISDKVTGVIRHAGSDGNIAGLLETVEHSVADGRLAVASRQLDCATADHDFTELERSVGTSPARLPVPAAPPPRNVVVAAVAPFAVAGPVRGVSDQEIRFGMAMPASGSVREAGRQLRFGIETAFALANDAGGVHGRRLRLIVADAAAEPMRAPDAMKQLDENDQVFGVVGNAGTETTAASLPYALEHRMLFFAPFTGAALSRQDPPDRYVFNYRAGYADETVAAVRYLLKDRKLGPERSRSSPNRIRSARPASPASTRRCGWWAVARPAGSCASATSATPSTCGTPSTSCAPAGVRSRRSSWWQPAGRRRNSSR